MSTKTPAVRAVNYWSRTCTVLALTSAKSDLPNKTLIFHDITGLKILKNPWLSRTGKWKSLISWLSRFFHDPYESCKNPEHKNIKTLRFSLAFAYASATAVLTSSLASYTHAYANACFRLTKGHGESQVEFIGQPSRLLSLCLSLCLRR